MSETLIAPDQSFTYSAADHLEAARLAARPTRQTWLAFIPITAAGVGITDTLHDPMMTLLACLYTPLGGLGGICIQRYIYLPLRTRHTMKHDPLFHQPRTIRLTEAGILIHTEGSEISLAWTDIVRWRGNRKTTILFIKPRAYITIPNRLAAQGLDIAHLRARLAQSCGPER